MGRDLEKTGLTWRKVVYCWRKEIKSCWRRECRFAFFLLYCKPNIQRGLFKIFIYDGMFCVGIAEALRPSWITSKAACTNLPVSFNGFSGNTCFKHSSRIRFEEQSCTNPSILWAPKCLDSDSWHAAQWAHGNTGTIERLISSCCLQAFETSEKSISLSRSTVLSVTVSLLA